MNAIRNTKIQLWDDRPHRNNRIFQRVHPDRVFPAQFVWIGRADLAIPLHPVNKLNIVQVEVHDMRIHTVVRNLPELRSITGCA